MYEQQHIYLRYTIGMSRNIVKLEAAVRSVTVTKTCKRVNIVSVISFFKSWSVERSQSAEHHLFLSNSMRC